jgi:hypothetical protein
LSQGEEDDQHAEYDSKSSADTHEKAAPSYRHEMSGNDRGQNKGSRDEESRALPAEQYLGGHAPAPSMEHERVTDAREYWKDYGPDRSVIQKACVFSERHLDAEEQNREEKAQRRDGREKETSANGQPRDQSRGNDQEHDLERQDHDQDEPLLRTQRGRRPAPPQNGNLRHGQKNQQPK